jgi:leucyl-tRNA synthetase
MKLSNSFESIFDQLEGNPPSMVSANDIAASSLVSVAEAQWYAFSEAFSILLRLLSPIAPHITQTLWKELGYGEDILAAPWPEVDEAALVQDEIELMIQVNGKLRGSLRVAKDTDKAMLEQLTLAHEAVQKLLAGGAAKKVIVVPGRLINVVI